MADKQLMTKTPKLLRPTDQKNPGKRVPFCKKKHTKMRRAQQQTDGDSLWIKKALSIFPGLGPDSKDTNIHPDPTAPEAASYSGILYITHTCTRILI